MLEYTLFYGLSRFIFRFLFLRFILWFFFWFHLPEAGKHHNTEYFPLWLCWQQFRQQFRRCCGLFWMWLESLVLPGIMENPPGLPDRRKCGFFRHFAQCFKLSDNLVNCVSKSQIFIFCPPSLPPYSFTPLHYI